MVSLLYLVQLLLCAVDFFAMAMQVALLLGFVAAAGSRAEVTRLLPAVPLPMHLE